MQHFGKIAHKVAKSKYIFDIKLSVGPPPHHLDLLFCKSVQHSVLFFIISVSCFVGFLLHVLK